MKRHPIRANSRNGTGSVYGDFRIRIRKLNRIGFSQARFPLRNGKRPKINRISRKFLPDTLRIRNVVAADSRIGLYGPMNRHPIRANSGNGTGSVKVNFRIRIRNVDRCGGSGTR